MPDTTVYPLLRSSRRRPFALPNLGPRLRPIAIGLIAFAGVMTGVVVSTRPAPVDVAAALAASRSTLAEGNYNAARANAQAALRAEPRSREAHLLLARAYLALEEGGSAEVELTRARELGARPADLAHLLARARLLQGDAEGASSLADQVDASHAADALRVRAGALAIQGRRGAALRLLEDTARDAPGDARVWSDLGRLRFSGGEVGTADVAATRAVTLAPREPGALTLKGEIVRGRFGLVAGLPWFTAALSRDAFHYPALIEQAATLGELGRYREMLAASRAALLARPGAPHALYLQAALAARAGKPDLARAVLARAGSAADAMPGAIGLAGMLDAAVGKHEQAIDRWRALVRVQPMNLRARILLAAALLRSGDAGATVQLLAPVLRRDDADPYALTLAARALEAIGDRGRAAILLDRSARATGSGAAVFATSEASDMLASAARRAPGDPTYAVGLIRGLADDGRGTAAIGAAQALVRATPGAPDAQAALGDALAARGRWNEAANAYRRAADLRFDEPALLRLVDALGRAGRPRDAAGALSLYLSQNPHSPVAQRLLGRWQIAAGDWGAAIETLERVRARVGSGDAGLLADLARAYAGDGDGTVARRYAAAAYALAPMNEPVVVSYAAALTADGDRDGARQLVLKLRALPRG